MDRPYSTLQDAASFYAESMEWLVFPCLPGTKKRRLKKEQTDRWGPEQVRKHWKMYPDDNIAINCKDEDLIVVDADTYKDDCNWHDFLDAEQIEIPATWSARTGSGGIHVYFDLVDDDAEIAFSKAIPGVERVDVQHNAIVVLPPSVSSNEQEYEWIGAPWVVDLAPRPEWLEPKARSAETVMADVQDMHHMDDGGALLDLLERTPNVARDYEQWRNIAMGLHHQYSDTEREAEALRALLMWTATAPDYGDAAAIKKAQSIWAGFRRRNDGGGAKITAGTTVKYLRDLEAEYASDPQRYTAEAELLHEAFGKRAPAEVPPAPVKPEPKEPRAPVKPFDPSWVPRPRPWLHGRDLIRGYVTALVSPGGRGKSSLVSVMALALAGHQPLLGQHTHKPCNVLLWSGEDDTEELQRRLAAATRHHGVDTAGRLWVETWMDRPIELAQEIQLPGKAKEVVVNASEMKDLQLMILERELDVLILDPFVRTHKLNENDNTHVDVVMQALSEIAVRCDCAILVVHHSAKQTLKRGSEDDTAVEGARGASAFTNASRVTLALRPIGQQDAVAANILLEDQDSYVEIVDAKANMSKKRRGSTRQRFFHMQTVPLDNSNDDYPDGDEVGVAVAWDMPDGSSAHITHELSLIAAAMREDAEANIETPDAMYNKAHPASGLWLGYLAARALELDVGEATLRAEDRTDVQQQNRDHINGAINRLVECKAVVRSSVTDEHRKSRPAYILDPQAAILIDRRGKGE